MIQPLLAADEPPAFEVINPTGRGPVVLVCDHASNRVPRSLNALGLTRANLASHIAWDPGAAAVAQAIAKRLDAPLVRSGYSRLVVDCNRPPASPELMAQHSAGVVVPGNLALTAQARQQRLDTLYLPYHAAIADVLDQRAGRPHALLSIHSFSPMWDGARRPWPLGLCYGADRRLADLLRPHLAAAGVQPIGDNQPYDIDPVFDHTIPVHGEARHIPHVMIEIRNDKIATPETARHWAQVISDTFAAATPTLFDPEGR